MSTKPKTNIFQNANGTDYVILKQKDDIALLAAVGISQFVVCYGLDYNSNCWGGGSYFSNLDDALKCFERVE